ncbi:3-coathanger stack domain-containing protein [Jiulongibacter sp. NS-SX5]|uniref:3-coathanger stack domain-containing protein n=1 Tax=Jiulongibacter sp. NS-SX5 TaxID=3463854 RepID=UPI004058F425
MKKLIFLSLFAFSSAVSVAQISLSLPVERMIYQRNNSNQAYIHITGNFTAEYDSITAKVFPRVSGQGTEGSWQTIDYRDDKPYFYGKYLANGGWYKLGVKAYKDGVVIDSVGRERVGIGEVFVVAGQSNASGITDYVDPNVGNYPTGIGYDSDEDRSNVMHFSNGENTYDLLPIGFSKMASTDVANDTLFIGPFQSAPWCWGKVSEDLVTALNVPVLFYGAAFGGTKVQWWKESANGEPLTNPSFFIKEEFDHPYGALAIVMKMYTGLTGLRSVLWHQGESDHGTASSTYRAYLEQVIAKTREHSEVPNLTWMVARASYSFNPASNVINGQQATIDNDANVFNGPTTDNITGTTYRHDNIHMDTDAGILEHASYWVNSITGGFLSSSTPTLATDLIEPTMSCNTSNASTPITLTSPATYNNYAWSNRNNTDAEAEGEFGNCCRSHTVLPGPNYIRLNWGYDSTNSITVGSGVYALNVRKPTSEKILFSPLIDLSTLTLPTNPSFTASAGQIRPGDSVTLTGANCNGTYQWSNGSFGSPLTFSPASTDSYTLACKTLHCLSNSTSPTQVVVSSCFPNALNISGTVSSSESPYQSQQSLQSQQIISSPSGNIQYTAAQSVTLNPGFRADNGSVFRASISNCP